MIRHLGEGTPVTVRLTGVRGGGPIRVAVTDPDPCTCPVRREAAGGDEGGRGLALLEGVDYGPAVIHGVALRG
ncbi:hypothetical protein ACQB60_13225 [Actinomycetota bacterium Odt1-20B]